MFRPIFKTWKMYVGFQYTIYITWSESCYRHYSSQMGCNVNCQNTTYLMWSKSYLYSILSTVKVQVIRNYTNFITWQRSCFQTNFYSVSLFITNSCIYQLKTISQFTFKTVTSVKCKLLYVIFLILILVLCGIVCWNSYSWVSYISSLRNKRSLTVANKH